ncbi:hypothetical protein [Burkholderia aenigmatica]|uniref:hypothetical protein n=1 Tax=Burkholderia aenigmatica TaxID=2015348 RepID=UPI00265565F6|nr:hypothetical protein [Burkholderia aenigmatica]MDN7873835.1 hypothetical protein [Burkholderia aenigmatica]
MGGTHNYEEMQAPGPTPFDIGQTAFWEGAALGDNPFEWLSDDWHAWRSGFYRAEAVFAQGESF